MHQFHQFTLSWNSTSSGQFVCPSSGVCSLYTQQWYMSYRFVGSFRAGPRCNCSSILVLLKCREDLFTYWRKSPPRMLPEYSAQQTGASPRFLITFHEMLGLIWLNGGGPLVCCHHLLAPIAYTFQTTFRFWGPSESTLLGFTVLQELWGTNLMYRSWRAEFQSGRCKNYMIVRYTNNHACY